VDAVDAFSIPGSGSNEKKTKESVHFVHFVHWLVPLVANGVYLNDFNMFNQSSPADKVLFHTGCRTDGAVVSA
jgi:hypothetical protein